MDIYCRVLSRSEMRGTSSLAHRGDIPSGSMIACPMVRKAPLNLGPCYARAPYGVVTNKVSKCHQNHQFISR